MLGSNSYLLIKAKKQNRTIAHSLTTPNIDRQVTFLCIFCYIFPVTSDENREVYQQRGIIMIMYHHKVLTPLKFDVF